MVARSDVMECIPSVGVGVYAKDVFDQLRIKYDSDRDFVKKVLREGIDSGAIVTDSQFRLTKKEKTNAL